ncbi:uncharacterized [Tachysurus ichikawai]
MCEAVQHHWTFMIHHLELHTVPDAADPPGAGIKHDVIGVAEEAEEVKGRNAAPLHRAWGKILRCLLYLSRTKSDNKARRSRAVQTVTGGSRMFPVSAPLRSRTPTDGAEKSPSCSPPPPPPGGGTRCI